MAMVQVTMRILNAEDVHDKSVGVEVVGALWYKYETQKKRSTIKYECRFLYEAEKLAHVSDIYHHIG